MFYLSLSFPNTGAGRKTGVLVLLGALLGGCSLNPHNVDVELTEHPVQAKASNFDSAMRDLGLMSQIYDSKKVHIMARDIIDNTGSSIATEAEIPRDVTEMLKTTLNGFGGNVVFIPYDPDFILNSANTGYSGFREKLMPDVVVSGGITEFDRGLETRGKNTDLALEGSIDDNDIGVDFSDQEKASLASITLDFNLVNFKTLAGIPRMQAVNHIKVEKAQAENSLAFSIIGNTVGLKGEVKKVQGRHAAVRLVVQVSMIEVLGKYLALPYWRLLPNVGRDPVVVDQVLAQLYTMDEPTRVRKVQEYLALNGYVVTLTGKLDEPTQAALADFVSKRPGLKATVNDETYLALFESVPLDFSTLQKRRLIGSLQDSAVAANSEVSRDGRLRVSANSRTLQVGEDVRLDFQVAVPMYVRIFNVSSAGEVLSLFPNEFQGDGLLLPGSHYRIPSADAGYALKVTGPAGQERILAVASPEPVPAELQVVDPNGQLTEEAKAFFPTAVEMNIQVQ